MATWSWPSVHTNKQLENQRISLCFLTNSSQNPDVKFFWKIVSKTFKKLTTIVPDRLGTPSGHGGTYKTQIFGNYMFVKMATGFPAISIQPWPTLAWIKNTYNIIYEPKTEPRQCLKKALLNNILYYSFFGVWFSWNWQNSLSPEI